MKSRLSVAQIVTLVCIAGTGAALFALKDRIAGADIGTKRLPSLTVQHPAPSTPPQSSTSDQSMAAPSSLPEFGPVGPLKSGLAALSGRNIDEARLARDNLPANSLDRHILAWAIALYGGDSVPSADIEQAAEQLPAWPGNAALRRNAERSLYKESSTPELTVQRFAGLEPQTIEGAIALARAHLALGNRQAAREALAALWRTAELSEGDEVIVISEFATLLSPEDHRIRMERMLYAGRTQSAQRVAGFAGAAELGKAWAAALGRERETGKLLDAVPESQRDAGYIFAKVRFLRSKNRTDEAAALLAKAPTDKDKLLDPDAWWSERRLIARRLLDAGKARLAYRVVAGHAAESPAEAADAEFHAGWIALRFLKDPALAKTHFARIAELGEGPITLARAYYWQGRAAQAEGSDKALGLYSQAARYGTTFYGQLAAAKAGSTALKVDYPQPTSSDKQSFQSREAVRAIDRLQEAGYPQYVARLYIELAQQLTSPGELALLAAKAEAGNSHFLGLRVGKIAAQRGIDVGGLTHPVGVIPDGTEMSGAGKALAYAVARQESEFNVGAVSGAGALGLLQLMPETARETAKKIGLEFSAPRLTNDAAYNATLGAEVLSQQLARFGGSYVLTFAAYNAGPRRADQWVARFGDPRGKSVDEVVDWIERVPFSETRSYIQRVLENYEVYKMRLQGQFDLESDLSNGRTASTP